MSAYQGRTEAIRRTLGATRMTHSGPRRDFRLLTHSTENSLCSGLDDTLDELSIVHAPLAKPSDRLPQLVTIIREPIFRFRRHLLIDSAFQKPVPFKAPRSLT